MLTCRKIINYFVYNHRDNRLAKLFNKKRAFYDKLLNDYSCYKLVSEYNFFSADINVEWQQKSHRLYKKFYDKGRINDFKIP